MRDLGGGGAVGRGAAVRTLDVGHQLLVAGCDDGSVALFAAVSVAGC